jgi:metal-responsive CopG/Arc/MetJ family transcriptional regulator
MRTTIAVDDALLDELMQAHRGVTRSEAIRRAIQSHLRHRREHEFMALAGTRLVDLDWRDAERQDLVESGRVGSRARGKRRARQG